MNALKRILLFVVCFFVIGFASCLIIGVIIGAIAVHDAGVAAHASGVGKSAARSFGQHYMLHIWLGALVLSAAIAFRWIGGLLATTLAAVLYFFTGGTISSPEPPQPDRQASAPASPTVKPSTTVVGRSMTLATPITIDVPYGKAQIPAGTQVLVLSETGDNVRIRVSGSQTTFVPRTSLK